MLLLAVVGRLVVLLVLDLAKGFVGCEDCVVWPRDGEATEGGIEEGGGGGRAALRLGAIAVEKRVSATAASI